MFPVKKQLSEEQELFLEEITPNYCLLPPREFHENIMYAVCKYFTHLDLQIINELIWFDMADAIASPTQSRLAFILCVEEELINKRIRLICNSGFIYYYHQRGKPNVYIISDFLKYKKNVWVLISLIPNLKYYLV